ncbi:hypothetical protein SAMN05216218_10926 [Halorientalis regularis]|uniref:Uncharacterized protein n=1 Tax=Halorientalis regularis TaxID=660518 RepID=A0A1G7NLG0_9EURY|nr:hypothetical protein SAMN05216218_10926 [Halorientalis regularis]
MPGSFMIDETGVAVCAALRSESGCTDTALTR